MRREKVRVGSRNKFQDNYDCQRDNRQYYINKTMFKKRLEE